MKWEAKRKSVHFLHQFCCRNHYYLVQQIAEHEQMACGTPLNLDYFEEATVKGLKKKMLQLPRGNVEE